MISMYSNDLAYYKLQFRFHCASLGNFNTQTTLLSSKWLQYIDFINKRRCVFSETFFRKILDEYLRWYFVDHFDICLLTFNFYFGNENFYSTFRYLHDDFNRLNWKTTIWVPFILKLFEWPSLSTISICSKVISLQLRNNRNT